MAPPCCALCAEHKPEDDFRNEKGQIMKMYRACQGPQRLREAKWRVAKKQTKSAGPEDFAASNLPPETKKDVRSTFGMLGLNGSFRKTNPPSKKQGKEGHRAGEGKSDGDLAAGNRTTFSQGKILCGLANTLLESMAYRGGSNHSKGDAAL